MLRQFVPYGAGPSSFPTGLGPSAAFGAPAPAGALDVPFGVSNGPSSKGILPSLNVPFSVDGFYHSAATQGFSTNATVTHHYIAMQNQADKESRGRLADLSEGMLVFARNPLKVNIAGRTTVGQRFEVPESSNTVELLELNQLNDWLADKAIDTYASADDLLAEWQLLGVVKVEVAPKRSSSLEVRSLSSRVLNLVVQGRVGIVNLFGNVTAGDRLYLVVKIEYSNAHSKRRWVVKPFVGRDGSVPGAAALRNDYGDEFFSFGRWVYLGIAQESAADPSAKGQPTFGTTLRAKQVVQPLVVQLRV